MSSNHSDNLKVCVRIRPLNAREVKKNSSFKNVPRITNTTSRMDDATYTYSIIEVFY